MITFVLLWILEVSMALPSAQLVNLRCLENSELVPAVREWGNCKTEIGWNFYYSKEHGKCFAKRTFMSCPNVPVPFDNLSECEDTCSFQVVDKTFARSDRCLQKQSEKSCTDKVNGFAWDYSEGRCLKHAGCDSDGNANFFEDIDDCMETCAPSESPYMFTVESEKGKKNPGVEMTGEDLDITVYTGKDLKETCNGDKHLKDGMIHKGLPCNIYKFKWTFNKSAGKCEMFLSNGCRDGINVFDSEFDCQELCIEAMRWHT